MSLTYDICENESTDPWFLACKTGNIRELDILKDNYDKIHINALCSACKCGHLDVLEWFDKHIRIKRREWMYIIENCASIGCHIEVFDWLKNKGYYTYTPYECVYSAIENGDIELLDWFNISDDELAKLIYDEYFIQTACKSGQMVVLEWLKKRGYIIECPYILDEGLQLAKQNGHTDLLEWFDKQYKK